MSITKKELYPTYPVMEEQMRDILAIIGYLNGINTAAEARETKNQWGDGFRAVLVSPIPVKTDARSAQELLGWLVDGELGWSFTQEPPADWLKMVSDVHGLTL